MEIEPLLEAVVELGRLAREPVPSCELVLALGARAGETGGVLVARDGLRRRDEAVACGTAKRFFAAPERDALLAHRPPLSSTRSLASGRNGAVVQLGFARKYFLEEISDPETGGRVLVARPAPHGDGKAGPSPFPG